MATNREKGKEKFIFTYMPQLTNELWNLYLFNCQIDQVHVKHIAEVQIDVSKNL